MPLDWDVLLDDVSIKTQIAGFQVRESKGAYARELTLFAADPLFYDQFDYTTIPLLRIEIKTKIAATWVSQGSFFIERPGIFSTPDSIMSPGVWGRSETAVAGPPFAAKVSKTWAADTTVQDIITEMADLCDLTVIFEIDNFPVFANSYAVDGMYPIDVISDLAGFCGGHIGCTPAGALIIRPEIFHPAAADYTITDDDISDLSEHLEYPEFGNRIRISAFGAGAGYQVTLQALNDDDCLPADGVSKGTLLAFVTDNEGEPVPDNTLVTWSVEDGAALDNVRTNTGNYLLQNRKHQANNYESVDVDFPITAVIGIWAYADASGKNNYWNEDYCSFEGRTITVSPGFDFCDQSLRIAYITGGCAVNKVTAGSTAMDVEVSAQVEGAGDTIEIKQGNTCACGSGLNAKVNPYGAICIGNLAHILVWATINNAPATGYPVQLRQMSGCGELSSENKTLKTVSILNEAGYVSNTITGVSQVQTEIIPADAATPEVYLKSDTEKATDLYASHDGPLIDLTTVQTTGAEVVIDYTADGATLVAWRTLDADKDCDAEVVVKMADGTEAGLTQDVSLSATDCSEPEEIPDHNEDWSDYDPTEDDQDSDEGGFEDDGNDYDAGVGGGVTLTDCETAELNRIINLPNAVTEEEKDAARFGTGSMANCPQGEDEWSCSCADLCLDEVMTRGSTYDESQTIHEILIADGYEKDTPEYNEAFEIEKQEQLATCQSNCNAARLELCEAGCGVISYTSQQIGIDEQQTLEVTTPTEGYTYTWAIASGGGSLSASEGTSVTYFAPSTNANCANNPTITLSVGEVLCDTLEMAIEAIATGFAYHIRTCGYEQRCLPPGTEGCPSSTGCCQCASFKLTVHLCDGRAYDSCGTQPEGSIGSYGPEYTTKNCADCQTYICDGDYANQSPDCLTIEENFCAAFGNIGEYGVMDVRTEQQIQDGCCPAALL